MVQGKPVAVILAAGLGKRMNKGLPKPLVPLLGLPIIEHTIRAFKRLGLEIIVVYNREEIRSYIESNFPDIKLIKNQNPERENGYSLYLAKNAIGNRDFLLAMGDHYYSNAFFEGIDRKRNFTTAFVSSYCHNPQEATKVKTKRNKIVDIGKELEDYNYFDTGLFFCKPEIFNFASRLVEEREQVKLADIFKEASKEEKVRYEVIDDFWIDIDTPEELKIAEKNHRK